MDKNINLKNLVEEANIIAIEAGEAILNLYLNNKIEAIEKKDSSPLTQADLASNQIIVEKIKALNLDFPILSEEINLPSFGIRSSWKTYWLIDPLDGTKEFVNKSGEFTVNIALIQNNQPILGVVYCPTSQLLYYAYKNNGAYKKSKSEFIEIKTKKGNQEGGFVIVGSKSHGSGELQYFVKWINEKIKKEPIFMSIGSSLKICMVAEGLANIYPRFGPTSEWDIAAAHIILSEAGGVLLEENGDEIQYNTKESILNPTFFALSSESEKWILDFKYKS